jgi:outer membrane protein
LRNAQDNSKVDLKAMIGELPASLRLMDDTISLSRPAPNDAEAWIQSAYDQNPQVIAKRFEVEEAQKAVEQQRGGHFPTVDLTASYNKDNTGGSLFGGGSEVDTGMVMLELNVPIYSGGAVTSRYREAVSVHNQIKEELRAIMNELERHIVTAMNGVNNSIAKVEALDKLVEASETSVELKRTAYETGLASTIDVLDAERNLFFARSEYARARYEYVITIIALKYAAGLLSADDMIELDQSILSGTGVLPLR